MRTLVTLVLLALLAGCASGPDSRKRDEALHLYAGMIRWGDFDSALGFVDPERLKAKPLTAAERARYDQIQITGYTEQGLTQPSKDELLQTVEIRLVNRHNLVERVVIDRQRWRWDAAAKRWWLVSGLPDIGGR